MDDRTLIDHAINDAINWQEILLGAYLHCSKEDQAPFRKRLKEYKVLAKKRRKQWTTT